MEIKLTQGDVIIRKVAQLPKDATKLETKVLQPSETHGKFHRFAETAAVNVYETGRASDLPLNVNSLSEDTGRYFEVLSSEGAVLFHGKEFDLTPSKDTGTDHNALPIPQGIYEVIITSEYDHFKEMTRRVID